MCVAPGAQRGSPQVIDEGALEATPVAAIVEHPSVREQDFVKAVEGPGHRGIEVPGAPGVRGPRGNRAESISGLCRRDRSGPGGAGTRGGRRPEPALARTKAIVD